MGTPKRAVLQLFLKRSASYLLVTLVVCFGLIAPALAQPKPASEPLKDINLRLLEMAHGVGRGPAPDLQDYRIGPEDLVEISVFEVPELSRTVRVSASGELSLPLVGTVKAAGLSPVRLEELLTSRLKKTYVRDPQVSVFLKEFKSDPVSVMGAVKMPGLYQIQTRKSLIEVLAMAQGFSEGPVHQPGRSIIVTRKSAGGPTSPSSAPATVPAVTSTGEPEIVEIPIKDLLQTGDPKWNVPIYPGDVVRVVPAGTVYVAGSVTRPGGFPLTDFDNIGAIQAVAMAGGTTKAANQKNAVIIRRDAAGTRVEQKINLARVLKGQDPDSTLGPGDILFVPSSTGMAATLKGIEAAIQAATMMAYRIP